MTTGPVGFGVGEQERGPAGMNVQEPLGEGVDELVEDIHAIRQKYVDGAVNFRVALQFATAYSVIRQDMTGQAVNCIILAATTGLIYGYLSDVSGQAGKAPSCPDFVVSAGVVPACIQIMIPLGSNYIVSFQEASNLTTTIGCARLMKI